MRGFWAVLIVSSSLAFGSVTDAWALNSLSPEEIKQKIDQNLAMFDEAHVRAANTYLDAYDLLSRADELAILDEVMAYAYVLQYNPEAKEEDIKLFVKRVGEKIGPTDPEYRRKLFLLFVIGAFSKDDLFQIETFFKSDIGKKFVEGNKKFNERAFWTLLGKSNSISVFGEMFPNSVGMKDKIRMPTYLERHCKTVENGRCER